MIAGGLEVFVHLSRRMTTTWPPAGQLEQNIQEESSYPEIHSVLCWSAKSSVVSILVLSYDSTLERQHEDLETS
jgi:hypothetical protein